MSRLILGLFLTILASASSAHQLKSAITTVLFNDRTNNIEVMHRFYLHDAEHAVSHLFKDKIGKQVDLIADKNTQETFSLYVENQFKLATLKNEKLLLKSVGHQLDGQFFWVYQETKIQKNVKGFRMSHGALRDLWPAQVNMVNVEGKGKVKTLTFSGEDTWLETTFENK
ncbi:DUF6702 family protein [Pseudoalteromonas denitrificans]|jgi:hypothetical protein|uniref:Orphan protein n=1 Tax=Pseudoalteromonas denitrificans DSM 6059 TaxID=1123010 RepID=A0A1I1RTF1_9GAMM|nr:DUF6702 family protein [Pseudoalteromonas denitrificans]SFD37545.1 hypothetical protein SAMN02745724_04339 [Pseudoalteromonas denitrificans DSM 6059]